MGANNFMWLVNDRTGKRVRLAGWWPDIGWCPPSGNTQAQVATNVFDAFTEDPEDGSAHGNTDWRIEYEYAQGTGPGDVDAKGRS